MQFVRDLEEQSYDIHKGACAMQGTFAALRLHTGSGRCYITASAASAAKPTTAAAAAAAAAGTRALSQLTQEMWKPCGIWWHSASKQAELLMLSAMGTSSGVQR
jgi:hypothetical protein